MFLKRLALAGIVAGIGLATAGCTEGYGYTGLDVGYGAPGYGYYDSGYADPYYGGYGYGSSYFGWYGDFYYPGTGIYVYDRYRHPYRWNNNQQRYWQGRRSYRGDLHDNWGGFARNGSSYGQQGYRGYAYPNRGGDGRSFRGRGRNPGATTGTEGLESYRQRGYRNGYSAGEAVPNGARPWRGGEARSFGSRVAPSADSAPAGAAPQRGWRGGGRRGHR